MFTKNRFEVSVYQSADTVIINLLRTRQSVLRTRQSVAY